MDVYLLDDGPLLVRRPKGVLDGELDTKMVEFIEIKEALMETGFHRFCDMTQLEGIISLSTRLKRWRCTGARSLPT